METLKLNTYHLGFLKDQKFWVASTILVIARILFIYIMPYTFSNDVYGWQEVIRVMERGGNPYEETVYLNWPPLWMNILYVLNAIGKALSVSDIRMIQSFLIFCDFIVLVLIFHYLHSIGKLNYHFKTIIIAFCVNPAFLFLTCQHGNFDVLVSIFVLSFVLSLNLYSKNNHIKYWLFACLFLGLGILTKTIPVILTPILIFGILQRSVVQNIIGTVLTFSPVIIGMTIIYLNAPEAVTKNVLSYRSQPGTFGFTGVISITESKELFSIYKMMFYSGLVCVLLFFTIKYFNRKTISDKMIMSSAAFILILIPLLGPGYASQYVYWFFPLLLLIFVLSNDYHSKRIFTASLIVLICTYIVEYGLFNSHGAYLDKFIVNPKLTSFIAEAGKGVNQFMIRLPLFLVYLLIELKIGIYLWKELKGHSI